MKIKSLPSIICLLLFQTIWSQQLIPDSLTQKPVEDKIVFLNAKGQKQNAIDSSNIYFNEALKLAKTCDCDSLLLLTHFKKANNSIMKGNFDQGLRHLKALESQLLMIPNKVFEFRKETLYAYAYNLKDEDNKALKHLETALTLAKELKDSTRIAAAYNNLGNNFFTVNKEKARNYFHRALRIYKRHNSPKENLRVAYQNLAKTSTKLDSINYYSNLSFHNITDTTNAVTMIHFYINKANAMLSNNYYNSGKQPALQALKRSKAIQYDVVTQIALVMLGMIELEESNPFQAIKYLESSLKYKSSGLENKQSALEALAKAYKSVNEYQKALAINEQLMTLKDSIYTQIQSSKFAEFDAKFNLAEKDKAIAQQELEIARQKNARNQLIFGSIGLLLLGGIAILWFINKQKRKKDQVQMELKKEQEINQLRTKFLGNVAHEIRTPLTLVSGNLTLAIENLDHKTKAKKNLQVALNNTKKITDDANEILELLKYEGQKMTLNMTSVPLRISLERIVFSFHSMAQIKDVELNYNSNIANKIIVYTDISKIEKIINNLLSNAIKYAPSNSKIIVNDMFKNNTLTISVTDFGEGINYNEQKRIFERFYQSENASKIGGIGIGLSLSKEFAEFLNGNLLVDSNLGEGSTFTLQLPLQIIENTSENSNKLPKLIPQEQSNLINSMIRERILIVEDNPQMASYLKELLEDSYSCDIAFNGEEALNLLKTQSYSLIASDIMMPKVDGFELREKINTTEKHKNIPFIFISAKTLEVDKIKGFSLGIADYIVKPFNKNELIARVKNLLKNKAARIQWQLENTDQLSKTESSDQKLLRKIENYVIENIDNDDFKIKELADYVGYSQRQLARIMKQYTGMSPVKFILEIRLQKAFAHLQNKTFFTLSEVRYAVGISSSAYFNKKFKERFGVTPSELI